MASQHSPKAVGGGPESDLRLVLLGSVGAGKSVAAKRILGRENWRESGMCVKKQGEVAGRTVTVVDTPGWDRQSVNRTDPWIKKAIARSVTLCPPGPHALILVVSMKQTYPNSERKSIRHHMELLSERVWRHALVLFVTESEVEDHATLEQAMKSAGDLLKKCSGRHHVLCDSMTDRTQVSELLRKIEMMMEEECDEFFLPQVYHELMESRVPGDVAVLRRRYKDREEKLKQRHKLQLKELEDKVTELEDKVTELEDKLRGFETEKEPAEGLRKRKTSIQLIPPVMSPEKQDRVDEPVHQKIDLEAAREGGREAGVALITYYVKPILVIITVVMVAFVGAIAGAQRGPWGACVGSLLGVVVGILVSYAVREAATASRDGSPTSPVQAKCL